jgi:hypothetical protein
MAPTGIAMGGSAGIGLVWGWLVGRRLLCVCYRWQTFGLLGVASGAVIAEVELLAGPIATAAAALASVMSATAVVTWLVQMRSTLDKSGGRYRT